MDNRSPFRVLAVVILALAAAAVIGVGAYNAGMAHGFAQNAHAVAPGAGVVPYGYYWPRPWGFGFFPVFPLFFLLVLLFFVLRGGRGRGPWRGGWGCGYDGVPPAFDEWHRRAHGQQGPPNEAARPTA